MGPDQMAASSLEDFDREAARQWLRERIGVVQPRLREIRRLRETARRQYLVCHKAKVEAELTDRLAKTPIDKLVQPPSRDTVIKLKGAGIDLAYKLSPGMFEHLVNDLGINRDAANRLIHERKRLERGPKDSDVPAMNPQAWKPGIDHDLVRAWFLLRSADALEQSPSRKGANDHANTVESVLRRLSLAWWTMFPGGRQKTINQYGALVSAVTAGSFDAHLDTTERGVAEHLQLVSLLESREQVEIRWANEPERMRRTISTRARGKSL